MMTLPEIAAICVTPSRLRQAYAVVCLALPISMQCLAGGVASSATASPMLAVYTSAKDVMPRMALSASPMRTHADQLPETEVLVHVNTAQRFQTVLGIGGAITDAAAEVFDLLPPQRQEELLRAYFNPQAGLGYSLLRTTIHSTDFSSASYTYVKEGDLALTSFDIAPDRVHRLPMVKRALAAADGALTIYASPWSAPAFMKDNASMLGGGKLRTDSADAWARYIAKFIHAWEGAGVPLWGISVQNEPLASQTWESMIFSAEEERDFLKNHLGPVLQREGLADRKIIVWDHNRDLIAQRADVILSDPQAARYVWGVGYHWYETWAGGEPMVRNVDAMQSAWPNVNVLLTEAAIERFDSARLQDWSNGERYGNALVQDFNAGAVGWTDWNILLDERGGPNHVGNFCFAPVHADTRSGELHYTPAFFFLGHFSKFVRPGARRVSATTNRSALQTTAFLNSDGRLVTIVLNTSDLSLSYRLELDAEQAVITIPAHAIQTVLRAPVR